jgi:hypothetical protein
VSWMETALSLVAKSPSGKSARSEDVSGAVAELARRMEDGCSRVSTLGELEDLLAAGSILLQTQALRGDLVLPQVEAALHALDRARVGPSGIAVIGLGEKGHDVLCALAEGSGDGRSLRRFFLDFETARSRVVDPGVVSIILDAYPESGGASLPRYGEILKAAYRTAAGSQGLPPLLAETLSSSFQSHYVAHVVVGVEDPWITVAPDLLFDLRAFLGWGHRGRTIVHLLSRPSPRIRGSFREALEELERTKPFDDAFLVCVHESYIAGKVSGFIRLSARVPELLLYHQEGERRGALSSYGMASAAQVVGESSEHYLSRLEVAFRLAAPSWVTENVVLSELAPEQVYYVHPPESPPKEMAWKFCPEMLPIAIDGMEPTLCRIQCGLKLGDLRLG